MQIGSGETENSNMKKMLRTVSKLNGTFAVMSSKGPKYKDALL